MQVEEVEFGFIHIQGKFTQDPAYAGPRIGNKLKGGILQSMGGK